MATVTYKDTMKRLVSSPMRKTFTFLGVTLILLIILLMGAIKPTLTTISELRAEIRVRTDVNEKLQEKINNIGILQKIYEERKDDTSVIEIFFPSDMDYSLLLASLEQISANYGYELKSVNIVKAKKGETDEYKGMERVNLRINVEGRESNVSKFMKHLEGLPVIPNVRSMSITPDDNNEIESWVRMTVDMYMYKTI